VSAGVLYIVATPIGNLEDITLRALRVLKEADFIAAEDTRVSLKLLKHYDIPAKLISYHEHNSAHMGEAIISRLLEGETCALISDAGTPVISDPGAGLTRLCLQNGIRVVPVPGACAMVAALSASAIPSGRFAFEGFLSVKGRARREHLAQIKDEKRTMVFYEAPHKLLATLSDLLKVLGDREMAVARELTKLHEEIMHTTISEALKFYTENKPKGEFVLIVRGAPEAEGDLAAADEAIEGGISAGETVKESVRSARSLGMSRNEAYRKALEKKKKLGE